ncbi:hypothetical protein O0I10_008382 [Lichtheimia ornata]|uniref:Uncharacterized protein n=1 Tax=Lichtheimia ornata TaxID=688661 RepID=A0AAD7XZJ7_9FUNG|nr:uncharacterized protein O0I10_008382 [Lichtheimia ornata]KAJ8655942.1 hypothetical protein O0I10_008382 [Lichtheimia ornata]
MCATAFVLLSSVQAAPQGGSQDTSQDTSQGQGSQDASQDASHGHGRLTQLESAGKLIGQAWGAIMPDSVNQAAIAGAAGM